jgi:regulator of sigma E protease
MNFITTPVAFVFVLGVIIFVHEFGHLITAKAFGMRVFIFSFGFGKRLLGFQWGDTDIRLSAVPLGGYVKLEGEPEDHLSEDTSARGDGRDFTSRPRWQRLLVYLAGPAMNAALTIAVLTVIHMVGFAVDAARYDRPIVGAVDPPAAAAGLEPGDEILAIDGEPVHDWEDAQYHVVLRPDRALELKVRRGGAERTLTVRSEATGPDRMGTIGVYPLVRVGEVLERQPAAEAGLKPDDAILRIDGKPIKSFGEIPPLVKGAANRALDLEVYRDGNVVHIPITPRVTNGAPLIGIRPKMIIKKFGLPGAIAEAVAATWGMTRQTFDVVRGLLTLQISPKVLQGPFEIAQASGDAARSGPAYLFNFIAIISLQVGILNLFPLAPLDGGHMAILVAESVRRRDLSLTVKTWIMNAGALVIFLLIGFVLYSGASKLISQSTWLKGLLP